MRCGKGVVILRHLGAQLIIAYYWARPAIRVAGEWGGMFLLYPRHTKYAEEVYSFCRFHPFVSVFPSVRPSIRADAKYIPRLLILLMSGLFHHCWVHYNVRPWFHPLTLSITKFYFEVFGLLVTLQPLIKNFLYVVLGIPGRVLFHSTSMNPWVMPQGGTRGQNLGHPNKVVVYCSLFIQTTS